ncbi:MAG: ParA family protein, partial [Planctomycetes bacterium]|nr:ParA family protein [Planctomycetota bacterium]
CPPSLGVLSANALVAADWVVIPMQAEYLSLQGMAKLLEVIQLVQKRLNPALKIACVLPCMVDARTNLSTEVLREIDAHFGSILTKTRIRNNVKLAEAPSFGRTIFEHAPDSNGARDYESFGNEFLGMIGLAPRVEAPVAVAAAELPVDAPDEPADAPDKAPAEGATAPAHESARGDEPPPQEFAAEA